MFIDGSFLVGQFSFSQSKIKKLDFQAQLGGKLQFEDDY